jgi:hypothetical protein
VGLGTGVAVQQPKAPAQAPAQSPPRPPAPPPPSSNQRHRSRRTASSGDASGAASDGGAGGAAARGFGLLDSEDEDGGPQAAAGAAAAGPRGGGTSGAGGGGAGLDDNIGRDVLLPPGLCLVCHEPPGPGEPLLCPCSGLHGANCERAYHAACLGRLAAAGLRIQCRRGRGRGAGGAAAATAVACPAHYCHGCFLNSRQEKMWWCCGCWLRAYHPSKCLPPSAVPVEVERSRGSRRQAQQDGGGGGGSGSSSDSSGGSDDEDGGSGAALGRKRYVLCPWCRAAVVQGWRPEDGWVAGHRLLLPPEVVTERRAVAASRAASGGGGGASAGRSGAEGQDGQASTADPAVPPHAEQRQEDEARGPPQAPGAASALKHEPTSERLPPGSPLRGPAARPPSRSPLPPASPQPQQQQPLSARQAPRNVRARNAGSEAEHRGATAGSSLPCSRSGSDDEEGGGREAGGQAQARWRAFRPPRPAPKQIDTVDLTLSSDEDPRAPSTSAPAAHSGDAMDVDSAAGAAVGRAAAGAADTTRPHDGFDPQQQEAADPDHQQVADTERPPPEALFPDCTTLPVRPVISFRGFARLRDARLEREAADRAEAAAQRQASEQQAEQARAVQQQQQRVAQAAGAPEAHQQHGQQARPPAEEPRGAPAADARAQRQASAAAAAAAAKALAAAQAAGARPLPPWLRLAILEHAAAPRCRLVPVAAPGAAPPRGPGLELASPQTHFFVGSWDKAAGMFGARSYVPPAAFLNVPAADAVYDACVVLDRGRWCGSGGGGGGAPPAALHVHAVGGLRAWWRQPPGSGGGGGGGVEALDAPSRRPLPPGVLLLFQGPDDGGGGSGGGSGGGLPAAYQLVVDA